VNSKLYAVAQKERREVGLEESIQTDTASTKGDTSMEARQWRRLRDRD
jgi:hypothetical protein